MPKVDDLTREARLVSRAGITTVTRTFRVTGIVDNAYDVLFSGANFTGIPDIGDQYPGVNNEDYRVRSKVARPDGRGDAVLVVCTYSNKTGETWNQALPDSGSDGQDVKQFSTTLADFTTTLDSTTSPNPGGSPMVLTPPASASGASYLSVAKIKRPVGSVVFERTETVPPSARLRTLVGTVNSVPVPSASPVFGAGILLFTGLDARSLDGGRVWRVTYEFAYSSQGWRNRDRWKGPSGKPPQDAPETTWPIYDEADFNALGLDFSDDQAPLP